MEARQKARGRYDDWRLRGWRQERERTGGMEVGRTQEEAKRQKAESRTKCESISPVSYIYPRFPMVIDTHILLHLHYRSIPSLLK